MDQNISRVSNHFLLGIDEYFFFFTKQCVFCSFLGYVDKLGVAYEAPAVATGFGAYLAQVSINLVSFLFGAFFNYLSSFHEYTNSLHELLLNCYLCLPVSFQPLMRELLENKVEISKDEARALIERCLKVLYYRDARSYNRVRPVPVLHE